MLTEYEAEQLRAIANEWERLAIRGVDGGGFTCNVVARVAGYEARKDYEVMFGIGGYDRPGSEREIWKQKDLDKAKLRATMLGFFVAAHE